MCGPDSLSFAPRGATPPPGCPHWSLSRGSSTRAIVNTWLGLSPRRMPTPHRPCDLEYKLTGKSVSCAQALPYFFMVDSASHAWKSFIEQASLTDVGLRRANNQDSLVAAPAGSEADWRQRGHLFMVADGMGAHAAGELASKLACQGVAHTYRKLPEMPPAEALHQAILDANQQIFHRGQADPEFHGMGTTASVLVLTPEGAIVGHVGDSRVYRLRRHRLEQLTFDHSLVWEMQAAGQIPRDGAPTFVPKNIITRSLGPHSDVQVDLEGPFEMQQGDVFLICSDGLTGQVSDDEIGVLLGVLSPEEAVHTLIDLANLRGGPDNISTVCVRVAQPPPGNAESEEPESSSPGSPGVTVPPVAWAAGGIGLLGAGVLFLMALKLAALGVVLATLVVVLMLWALARPAEPERASRTSGRPLGSGPHSSTKCQPDAAAASNLSQVANHLREAAIEERWSVNWAKFDELNQTAQSAAEQGAFDRAARGFALAISFMMGEIRRQRKSVPPSADGGSLLSP